MKIHPVGGKLFHAYDRQTDRSKLIFTFHNSVDVPETVKVPLHTPQTPSCTHSWYLMGLGGQHHDAATLFFFLGPISLCTAALGLLCSPNISFSTASITLCLVWRGKGPLLRLCLCLLVLQSASQRHYNAVELTPCNSKWCAALFQSPSHKICRLDPHQTCPQYTSAPLQVHTLCRSQLPFLVDAYLT